MSSLVTLYTPTDADRVVDAAWLLLPGGLPRNMVSGFDIRLGTTGADSRASWFAAFEGKRQSIGERGVLRLTPAGRLALRIPTGGAVVAEVAPFGFPTLASPLAVQLQVGSSVVVPAHRSGEPAMQDAADALAQHGVAVGSGDQIVVRDLVPHGPEVFADDSHSSVNQEVSATSYTNGLVSITFVKPAWARHGWAHVDGGASGTSASAAIGRFFTALGDGTTDHGEKCSHTTATATVYADCNSFFGGWIDRTTTFTLRLKIDGGGASIDIDRQSIAGNVTWTA